MEEQLLLQMHFYFSDSNLSKDKFLRNKVFENEEGWVPLELFLSFNKIKKITTKLDDLKKAVEESPFLVFDEKKMAVRRKEKYIQKEIPPENSIYVEKLSPSWNHDTVRKLFSKYGKVTHVSLPKDAKKHHFRGFGFVEFETAEDAKNALKLNGYTDPTWINELIVISKVAWMENKKKLHELHTHQQTHLDISLDSVPHIVLTNIPENACVKQMRNLLSMYGTVVQVDLKDESKTDQHPLLTKSNCIVHFRSKVCVERCLYALNAHKQYMIPDKEIKARKLTEDEEKFYHRDNTKRESNSSTTTFNEKRQKL